MQLARYFCISVCLSRCISRFYDFTHDTLYRKSLQFHVLRVSRMRKYLYRVICTTAGRFACWLVVGLRFTSYTAVLCAIYIYTAASFHFTLVGSLPLANNGHHSASNSFSTTLAILCVTQGDCTHGLNMQCFFL